jgi:hypothetical protein
MKRYFLFTLILFSYCSCYAQDAKQFLSKFHTVDSIPQRLADCYTDFDSINRMPLKELNRFLISANEFTGTLVSQDTKYYYGFKYKLTNNLYVVSISKTYRTIGNIRFGLDVQFDIQLYIYDALKDSFISTLIIFSTDPIERIFRYRDKTFFIYVMESYYQIEDKHDAKIMRKVIQRTEKYVINDGLFEIKAIGEAGDL